jgi:hypothetical protein
MIELTLASCVGLTLILKYGKPTKFLRDFFSIKIPGLFECSLCLGFWSGIAHSIALGYMDPALWLFLIPFASAAISWLVDSSILAIEMVEIFLKDKVK